MIVVNVPDELPLPLPFFKQRFYMQMPQLKCTVQQSHLASGVFECLNFEFATIANSSKRSQLLQHSPFHACLSSQRLAFEGSHLQQAQQFLTPALKLNARCVPSRIAALEVKAALGTRVIHPNQAPITSAASQHCLLRIRRVPS